MAFTQRPTLSRVRVQASSLAVMLAALGGALAAFVVGLPMMTFGMLTGGPAALVGSDDMWVGWVVHMTAGVAFGAPYGMFVRTRDLRRGALYGGVYGFAIGVAFAWLALFSILRMEYFSMMGALDVALHVAWGAIIGFVTAWGLRRLAPGVGVRGSTRRP